MQIASRGNPTNKIWCVLEKPYESDFNSGSILSGSYGYQFDRLIEDAGLPYYDMFITCMKPDRSLQYDDQIVLDEFVKEANRYKPPFLLVLGEKAVGDLLPQTRQFKKPFKPRIESFAGSLLTCGALNYEHYALTTHPVDHICSNWDYRNIAVNLDLGHLREEYESYLKQQHHTPLPAYNITCGPDFVTLLEKLNEYEDADYLSIDIETLWMTKAKSKGTSFVGNPGFAYLLGIAPNDHEAVSFNLWGYTDRETLDIFRQLDRLFQKVRIIGQNFYNFDLNWLLRTGFSFTQENIFDTKIRHHILWAELPHALHFMTKQYTRTPYYKDEGRGFVPKNRHKLSQYQHYNGLDCCVTRAVFDEQEKELTERGLL